MSRNFTIDLERWDKLDIFSQMGNIYSEVGRSLKAKAGGDIHSEREAIARAIDLFDATTSSLIRRKSPQAKEVLRAKEQFLSVVYTADPTGPEAQKLDRYFFQFALAARLHR